MKIGIPKETKIEEHRISLIPEHVKLLVEAGHEVYVEKKAGKNCGFSDTEYRRAGAKIVDNVYSCNVVVRVKEPPFHTIHEGQIIMGYLHIEKGQNPKLLRKLISKHVTAYAYEEIRNKQGKRIVNLGKEAGIVGMYEGLREYGKINGGAFKKLKPLRTHLCFNEIYKEMSKIKLDKLKIYILGNGNVSHGAQSLLRHAHEKPMVLEKDKTPHMEKYLPDADIILNATVWYPGCPRIITKKLLGLMKKTALIVDVSCDKGGAIESCVPTTWTHPLYKCKGITHSCIDNLPSGMPRESSIHLSNMIIKHVLRVANGKHPENGLMIHAKAYKHKNTRKHVKHHL